MSSTDETKPAAKPGRRKKGEARRQKSSATESPAPVEMPSPAPEQEQVPQADPQPTVSEPLEAAVAEAMFTEAMVAEAMVAEADAVPADAPSPADAPESLEPAPVKSLTAESSPVSLQTIANAYRDSPENRSSSSGRFSSSSAAFEPSTRR